VRGCARPVRSIIGKANLSEWANFRSFAVLERLERGRRPDGESVRARSQPCGSSSGSGVAVAADLTTVAIGSETDGRSCAHPEDGDVGIKPTLV